MAAECPCGSGGTYETCCGPLHRGSAEARTAEQLMRARYSAFAVGDADYLLSSWDPATRPASVEFEPAVEWRRLRVIGVDGGGEDDDAGTVEFVAHYWDTVHGEYGRQHEHSRFVRRGGRWFYAEPVAGSAEEA